MADLSSTNNGSTSGETTFPFMKLAPELRNHIYSFVFLGIDEIPAARSGRRIPGPASAKIDSTPVHYKSIKDLLPYLALSRTSHCIRHESVHALRGLHRPTQLARGFQRQRNRSLRLHELHTRFDTHQCREHAAMSALQSRYTEPAYREVLHTPRHEPHGPKLRIR
jgi:hypothetical protein